jgi:pre-mRNA-splicing factor CWC22
VFDRFRAIAHEGEVDKRVQFTIEELYRVRARGFAAEGFPSVVEGSPLDLVPPATPAPTL